MLQISVYVTVSLVVRLSITLSKVVGSEVIKKAPFAIGDDASGRRRDSSVSVIVELGGEVLAVAVEEALAVVVVVVVLLVVDEVVASLVR